jgi:hypothetical protein
MTIVKFAVRAGLVGAGAYVAIRLVQKYQLVDKAVVLADELLTKVYTLAEGHVSTEDQTNDDDQEGPRDFAPFERLADARTGAVS